jgi:lipoprotein-releasing system permease protein
MPFQWFVALRYLVDAKGQSALILAAVSVGVSVIVFLSALINGLQASLIETTLGSQPHVTLRVAREAPRPLVAPEAGRAVARLVQPASQRLRSLDQWTVVMAGAERVAGVTAASPTVTGSGVATRAAARVSSRSSGSCATTARARERARSTRSISSCTTASSPASWVRPVPARARS